MARVDVLVYNNEEILEQRRLAMGYGCAYGKIILFGEHSVVYHQPAVALPFFDAKVEVWIQTNQIDVIDSSLCKENNSHLLSFIQFIKKQLHLTDKYKITIASTIPIGRGMGSSAAVVCAITKAFFNEIQKTLPKQLLWEYVQYGEKIAHGNPSGIDTSVVTYEQPIYFIKEKVIQPLTITTPLTLVVADTGEVGSTKEAVSKVAQQLPQKQHLINQMGLLATTSLEYPQNVGNAMNSIHTCLQELQLSTPVIDCLVTAAQQIGLGAKLTGSGLGGCVIALAKNTLNAKQIQQEWTTLGAKQTWTYTLEEQHD